MQVWAITSTAIVCSSCAGRKETHSSAHALTPDVCDTATVDAV